MKLDPKYFNGFIAVCAILALLAIVYSTIRYSQKQVTDFRNNIAEVELDTLAFRSYTNPDSLYLKNLYEYPLVLQFWSTWSGKSQQVNEFLHEFSSEQPGFIVVAAAVRDGEEQVLEYMNQVNYDFYFVEGTEFYQTIYIPGIPAQILIKKNGELFATHIGDDTEELKEKIIKLMSDE